MQQNGSRGRKYDAVLGANHLPVGAGGKFRTSAGAAKKLWIMKLQEVRKPSPDFARTAAMSISISPQPHAANARLRPTRGPREDPTGDGRVVVQALSSRP
ncbi:unnamed protein product [Symbiodinium microadriaticum]|nr:unnamed protein product [Symbiodinium microadriaticum]